MAVCDIIFKKLIENCYLFGRVAQLDRASACGAEGRRFDSCRDHQIVVLDTFG